MTERDLYTPFSHYIRDHWKLGSAVFEIKCVKGGTFPLALLKPHQERALLMAWVSGVYHKVSDMSMGQKPFDSFYVREVPGYVVVCFQRLACFIHIKDYQRFKRSFPDARSMTRKQCEEYSEIVSELK